MFLLKEVTTEFFFDIWAKMIQHEKLWFEWKEWIIIDFFLNVKIDGKTAYYQKIEESY